MIHFYNTSHVTLGVQYYELTCLTVEGQAVTVTDAMQESTV